MSFKDLWRPIAELDDIYRQDILLASPDLIDGDSNPLGISTGYYQDEEGWICVGWDMCNDEPVNKVVIPTHFMIIEGPFEQSTLAS